MKTKINLSALIFILLLTFVFTIINAMSLHYETTTFKVAGNCEMCKKRIETALQASTAVKSAEWDVQTRMVKLVYDPHAISLTKIHLLIADAGHDTDKVKAQEAVYKVLPGCCQYERAK